MRYRGCATLLVCVLFTLPWSAVADTAKGPINRSNPKVGTRQVYRPDCNGNGVYDLSDISKKNSRDINQNGIPDECSSECDATIIGRHQFGIIWDMLSWTVDYNNDGIIWLCLADGTEIVNPPDSFRGRIQIPRDNVHLYARPGDHVLIHNQKTNAGETNSDKTFYHSAIHVGNGRTGFRISNVEVRTEGPDAVGIIVSGQRSEVREIYGATIRLSGDSYAAVLVHSLGYLESLRNSKLELCSWSGGGIRMYSSGMIHSITETSIYEPANAICDTTAREAVRVEGQSWISRIDHLTIEIPHGNGIIVTSGSLVDFVEDLYLTTFGLFAVKVEPESYIGTLRSSFLANGYQYGWVVSAYGQPYPAIWNLENSVLLSPQHRWIAPNSHLGKMNDVTCIGMDGREETCPLP